MTMVALSEWGTAATGLRIDDVAFEEKSQTLAVASSHLDGDVWSGELDLVATDADQLESTKCVALTSGGSSVCWCSPHLCCVACDDGDVVCVTRGGQVSGRLGEHDGAATGVSAARGSLASSSFDKTVRVWDLETARSTLTCRHDNPVLALEWSDGDALCAGDESAVAAWDPRSAFVAARFETETAVSALCNVPNDRLYVGLESGEVLALDLRAGRHSGVEKALRGPVRSLCSTDGQIIAAGDDVFLASLETRSTFRLASRTPTSHTDYVRGLAAWSLSDDRRRLATGGWDGRLVLTGY